MSSDHNNNTENNTAESNTNTEDNSKKVYVDKDKGLVYLNNKIINKPHTVKHHIPKWVYYILLYIITLRIN